MRNVFRVIANRISIWTGNAYAFLIAVMVVVIWASTGALFNYSDTWQLVINTGTTIVTFLMVFLIQNTQNRDGKAVQLKLDELIRVTKGARNAYVGLEDLSDEELAQLDKEFKTLGQTPGALRALNKLHEKIDAEHQRRSGVREAASRMLHHSHTIDQPTDSQANQHL